MRNVHAFFVFAIFALFALVLILTATVSLLATKASASAPLDSGQWSRDARPSDIDCEWLATVFSNIAAMRDAGLPATVAQRMLLDAEGLPMEMRMALIPHVERVYSSISFSFMTPKEVLDFMLEPCGR